MFLTAKIFRGVPPKILDRHYKEILITDHRAKSYAGRPTHFEDLAREKKNKTSQLKHKFFRKLSFLLGLTRNLGQSPT